MRFDPATGDVLRFKGTKEASVIIPLKNGSMLVFDDRLADPRFIMYDREGHVESNFTMGQKGYARQFYLNDDESKAYLVFDCDNAQESHLYEVNLKEKPGLAGKLIGSLISSGVPAVLKDGRIVTFGKDSIYLLDAAGRKLSQYATSTELMKDLGPDAGAVNHPYGLGAGSFLEYRDMPFRHDMLTTAVNAKAQRNPSVYQRIPVEHSLSLGGCSFNEADKTLNWKAVVDKESAISAMGMQNEDEYKNLLTGVLEDRTLFDLALQDAIDIPAGAGRITMERQKINVEIPNGTKDPVKKSFIVSDPSHYLSALPVTTGTRSYLFAGTDDGLVYWYDMNKDRSPQCYDMGESVIKILAVSDSVIAVTTGGKVMVLKPRLEEGEHFGTALDLSKPVSFEEKTEFLDEENTLEIGGVKLEKRQWAHIGGLTRK